MMEVDDSYDSDDDDGETNVAPYMEELSHKYLALTHGTVVEFTKEEGHVGLPATIAAALIAQTKTKSAGALALAGKPADEVGISVTRTVDPAAAAAASSSTSTMKQNEQADGEEGDEQNIMNNQQHCRRQQP